MPHFDPTVSRHMSAEIFDQFGSAVVTLNRHLYLFERNPKIFCPGIGCSSSITRDPVRMNFTIIIAAINGVRAKKIARRCQKADGGINKGVRHQQDKGVRPL